MKIRTVKAWAVLCCAALLVTCSVYPQSVLAVQSPVKSRLVRNLESGKQQTVVTYGTSLTAGGAWVRQLQEALNSSYPGQAKVINSGMGGKWSKTGVDRLDTRVIDNKPDTVFIEFAINDAFLPYKTSVEQAKSNLGNMIERIVKSNPECEIILMAMNPPVGIHLQRRPMVKDYYQMYRDVAKERKLMLIDHYPNWEKILKDAELFKKYVPDGIHPGPEGCVNVITPQIIKSLGIKATQKNNGPALYNGPKDKLHVYLLIGQSNMAGRAAIPQEDSGVIERSYLLNSENKWEPAKNPLNRYSTIRKGLGMQKMNPGYTFAKTMAADDKDISIGLVVNAKGGSSIKSWAKGTRFYNEILKRAAIAQKTGAIKGILWHQGESDSKDAQYLSKLKSLVTNLRTDLKMPGLPFVAGQVNNVKLVNDQIASLPDVVNSTGFVSSVGLTATDRWHFDTRSMKLLGERYAREMLKIQNSGLPQEKIDWPAFMQNHDMTFDKLPQNWTQAPHFGNAMVGSMLYQTGDTIELQIFRADVHDHRDETYGWTAYSRPRLRIGHFSLHPVGKLTGCNWRKDLWNAELTGTITTDKGEITIRHFTHADDMAIVTELTPSAGEKGCTWTWHPIAATTTRGGYPVDEAGKKGFARRYGEHYMETLKPYKANPAGRQEEKGDVSVWVQDFLVGGQYATAWTEQTKKQTRTHIVSIANTYPESTAAATAVSDVKRFLKLSRSSWVKTHRNWWHEYYSRSFISIPEKDLESLYWQTIYRFGCTARAGRCIVDTPGLWFQGKSWPYFTTDWNIQSSLWPVYAANRLELGQGLVDRLHEKREELVKAVRPIEWQKDSAFLPIAVAWDMRGSRDGDMRYYDMVGTLPWTMHNMWWQYRYSMDDEMLREKIYPLLRRSINLYLHMVKDAPDGKLQLPPTFSPETGVFKHCNFDLALFKWGCYTLLKASKRLGINDPLIPKWEAVTKRLVDYPYDKYGFMLGRDKTSSGNHQHFSNLLMIYPLYLVNIEQEGTAEVLRNSFERALGTAGPGQRQGMVQAHAGPIGTAIGLEDKALKSLKLLQGDLYPNGLWYESPCIEATLSAANIIQDMLIQSWSDPAKDESGPIRIFPALPSTWKDVEFRDLRTEGAFLVSAKRTAGQTEWVRIKSLAGEPCRVRPGFTGQIRIKSKGKHKLKLVSPGIYQIDMKKGDEILLY